jgi:transcriptional regulator with XRE-family HTH domain
MSSTVNERVILLIEHFAGGVQKDFSERAGLPVATLANIVSSRRTKPGFEILEKIVSAYPQINAQWLLKGDGEMLSQYTSKPQDNGQDSQSAQLKSVQKEKEAIAREREALREDNLLLMKTNLNLSEVLILKYKAHLAEIELTRELLKAGLLTRKDLLPPEDESNPVAG